MGLGLRYKNEEQIFQEQYTEPPYLEYPMFRETGIVKHGFSTRIGGVSKGCFSSLNLSFTRGDEEEAVRENFRRIGSAMGIRCEDMVFTHQTHTTNVRVVTEADKGCGIVKPRTYSDVDGLVTDIPGICLVTFYADCVPLYFVDPVKKVIGLSHSGWRGTVGKIGKVTVETMCREFKSRPEDILAAVGPSICQDCYEVSEDVIRQFQKNFPEDCWDALFYQKENQKYQLNLWKANELIFYEAGILPEHIAVTNLCTHCNSEILYSHRQAGDARGNLCAFLALATEEIQDVVQSPEEVAKDVNQFVQWFEDQIPTLISFGIKVVLAIVFFFIGRAVIHGIQKMVKHSMQRANADTGVIQFVESFLKFGLYALLLFMIATNFGIETSSVAALIASGGVAIGLALQGSLSNFAGGVLILLLKPFVVGDYIIVANDGTEGTVKVIQIFYTKLTTVDNKTIVIPNGTLSNSSLTNVTARPERQLDLKVGIAYDADLKKAKDLIETLLKQDDSIIQDEDIKVFVDSLADSSVILGLRAWVKTEEYWSTRWRLLEEIKLIFDEEGIEIPFNQLTVHMAEK